MEVIQKTFIANIDYLHDVLDFLQLQLEKQNTSMKNINIICIAVEEMFANVSMYAYPNETGECKISIWFEDDAVNISIEDSGIEFNPLAKDDPDVHASIEDRGIGGLGIFMVKETMDECSYERVNEKNIFTMRKVIK